MYKNIFDTHTHSDHSFDGNNNCVDLCKCAVEKGAKGLAITDHCDIDGVNENCWSFEDKQFEDCRKAKILFEDKLEVYTGVELGQGIYRKELSEAFLEKYDFDFVLGSIHNLENMEDFYFLNYKEYDIDELLNRYFHDLLELAKWNKTDSLAHITYPLRYIISREGIDVDLSVYDDIITDIFGVIIRNNKALELNVSGLSMDMHDTLPNKSLIKKFYDMGGKYVTIGSDSHFCDKVCLNIDKVMDILKECVFQHFTIFKKIRQLLIPIV